MFPKAPQASLPQLYSDAMHLTAAVLIAVIAGILTYVGKISADVTGAVFTGVIGYIAGQARTLPRNVPTRSGDEAVKDGMIESH